MKVFRSTKTGVIISNSTKAELEEFLGEPIGSKAEEVEMSWQALADKGLKLLAIKAYREEKDSTLAEANNTVRWYMGDDFMIL